MSTLLYGALTTRRLCAQPGTSETTAPPGLGTYVDALAALVPGEVLALHALFLSVTTATVVDRDGFPQVTITEPVTLRWAFAGLIVLSVVLYLVPRFRTREKLDVGRALIPPLAFVAWTMLQRATAFDAVFPSLGDAPRTVIALFAAAVLGLVAARLAGSADRSPPPPATAAASP
ncbi:MAG TPA: hypothetical protein VEH62_07590 [Gemmatimonadales bacterium]|nr:hypothetical protein [Gemmatimonadales bacterium]